ncbi:hypothetical protein FOMPIDRAFT_1055735 [Fomitopsis schrenkii]|uniref:Uncharacterized protein n=1 Tax=Fomitopsis schrenkii TaxID=2126942 RepID=S8F455_FOMSC|nr:hypothetical protein FOMPIDRAFT_1055735 [Fomitopsis schrenkii]
MRSEGPGYHSVRNCGDAHTARKQYAAGPRDYQRAYTLIKPALPFAASSVLLKIARCHLHTGMLAVVREALAVTPGDMDALRLKMRWRAARTAFGARRRAYEE